MGVGGSDLRAAAACSPSCAPHHHLNSEFNGEGLGSTERRGDKGGGRTAETEKRTGGDEMGTEGRDGVGAGKRFPHALAATSHRWKKHSRGEESGQAT